MNYSSQKIGIITQARMTSTRLPGKILMKIKGKTILQYHIDRLSKLSHELIIATTTNHTDDVIKEFAETRNINYHRGDEQNVLSRYYDAALKFNIGVIVRVTSDCPFIDPYVINESVKKFIQLDNPNIYLSNAIERTYARGFDFEIFSFESLKEAFENAADQSDLEHVTPYIWKNRSGKIQLEHLKQNINNSHLRVTLDTAEDFELIKQLIEKYQAENLSYQEIEQILIDHPDLNAINAEIKQKKV